jgi:hypothetical protein
MNRLTQPSNPSGGEIELAWGHLAPKIDNRDFWFNQTVCGSAR